MVVDHRLEFSGLTPNLSTEKLWSVAEPGAFLAAFEKNVAFAADLGVIAFRVYLNEQEAVAVMMLCFDAKFLLEGIVHEGGVPVGICHFNGHVRHCSDGPHLDLGMRENYAVRTAVRFQT